MFIPRSEDGEKREQGSDGEAQGNKGGDGKDGEFRLVFKVWFPAFFIDVTWDSGHHSKGNSGNECNHN